MFFTVHRSSEGMNAPTPGEPQGDVAAATDRLEHHNEMMRGQWAYQAGRRLKASTIATPLGLVAAKPAKPIRCRLLDIPRYMQTGALYMTPQTSLCREGILLLEGNCTSHACCSRQYRQSQLADADNMLSSCHPDWPCEALLMNQTTKHT